MYCFIGAKGKDNECHYIETGKKEENKEPDKNKAKTKSKTEEKKERMVQCLSYMLL